MDKKRCSRCKETKIVSDFYPNKRRGDGRDCYCRICSRIKAVESYHANPEKKRKAKREWYKLHAEEDMKRSALWAKDNPERTREYQKKKYIKAMKTPKGTLNYRIKSLIQQSLRGKKCGRKWEDLVGYSVDDLKRHLEKKFKDGMSWDNRSEWHIDHIIPKSVFNYEKPEDEDFKRCWALKNLQPLWAKDNISKHNKLDHHFQPSLVF